MKRKMLVCLSAALAVTGLSACGQKKANDNVNKTNISFSWWGNDVRHMYTMDGVELFKENNKDISVNISYGIWTGYETRNKVWMESGTESDVMQINYSWLFEYSKDGNGYYNLYDLEDYIDLSTYSEEYISYGERDGKLNAIPIAMNTATVYFNKAIYDKYGLEIPKTWDDCFKVAETLSKDNIYVFGIAKKQAIIMLYSYYEQLTGKTAFNEEGEFLLDANDMQVILKFYKDLIDKKVLQPIDDYSKASFVNGEMSGTIIWVSDAGNYCKALKEAGGEPVMGTYPKMENAKSNGRYMKPATLYAIADDTRHPEEAARLLDFLINNEEYALMQGTEKGVPVSERAFNALNESGALGTYEYEASQAMKAQADEMTVLYPAYEKDAALDAFKNNALEYLYDKVSLEEISEKICEDIVTALGK